MNFQQVYYASGTRGWGESSQAHPAGYLLDVCFANGRIPDSEQTSGGIHESPGIWSVLQNWLACITMDLAHANP